MMSPAPLYSTRVREAVCYSYPTQDAQSLTSVCAFENTPYCAKTRPSGNDTIGSGSRRRLQCSKRLERFEETGGSCARRIKVYTFALSGTSARESACQGEIEMSPFLAK